MNVRTHPMGGQCVQARARTSNIAVCERLPGVVLVVDQFG